MTVLSILQEANHRSEGDQATSNTSVGMKQGIKQESHPFNYRGVTFFMADRQRNKVKSFVNSVCFYNRQPVKTNLFNQIIEMQALL